MYSTKRGAVSVAAAMLIAALTVSDASAQVSDTQNFTVTVDPELTITAPVAVSITHDTTDANQVFAAQSWTVTQNASAGAAVTFSTNQAFTNATANMKRNAKLDLAIATSDSAAGWTVSVASNQTDYANATPDEIATVSAASTAPGDAAFNLTVTFVDTDFSVLASGNYVTTVTGTITANP